MREQGPVQGLRWAGAPVADLSGLPGRWPPVQHLLKPGPDHRGLLHVQGIGEDMTAHQRWAWTVGIVAVYVAILVLSGLL